MIWVLYGLAALGACALVALLGLLLAHHEACGLSPVRWPWEGGRGAAAAPTAATAPSQVSSPAHARTNRGDTLLHFPPPPPRPFIRTAGQSAHLARVMALAKRAPVEFSRPPQSGSATRPPPPSSVRTSCPTCGAPCRATRVRDG